MIWKKIFKVLNADVKLIVRDPLLLFALCAAIVNILLLELAFPLISDYILSRTGFQINRYFTLIAITLVSVIPVLFGMVYAFIILDENDSHVLKGIYLTPEGKRNILYIRIITPAALSFLLLLISIIVIDPVPSEGWVRSVYISVLLAAQSSFALIFIGSMADNKVKGFVLTKLFGIFIVAVPVGMILHHPWNYFAFFSPLYWISWAWVDPIVTDSVLYGFISIVITIGGVAIFFRHFMRKHLN